MNTRPFVSLFLALSSLAFAQEKPAELPEVTTASLNASIRRGVDFLIAHQNSNGSWGSAAHTKDLNIYAPLPGAHQAYRAGASLRRPDGYDRECLRPGRLGVPSGAAG